MIDFIFQYGCYGLTFSSKKKKNQPYYIVKNKKGKKSSIIRSRNKNIFFHFTQSIGRISWYIYIYIYVHTYIMCFFFPFFPLELKWVGGWNFYLFKYCLLSPSPCSINWHLAFLNFGDICRRNFKIRFFFHDFRFNFREYMITYCHVI